MSTEYSSVATTTTTTAATAAAAAASVIQHYKKQLIHRQDDDRHGLQYVVTNNGDDNDNNNKCGIQSDNNNNTNKPGRRKKRKNRNCRGQFRHETMELIKLGTNYPTALCKNSIPIPNLSHNLQHRPPLEQTNQKPTPILQKSDIATTKHETIIKPLQPPPPHIHPHYHRHPNAHPPYPPIPITTSGVHTLPQMVPERRKSRETIDPFIRRPPPLPPPLPPQPPRPSLPQTAPVIVSETRFRPYHQPVIQSAPKRLQPSSTTTNLPPPPPYHSNHHLEPVETKRHQCECGKSVKCNNRSSSNNNSDSQTRQSSNTYLGDVLLKGVLVVGRCPVIVDGRGRVKSTETQTIEEPPVQKQQQVEPPPPKKVAKEKTQFLIKDIINQAPEAPKPGVIVRKPVDHSVDALLSPNRRRPSTDLDATSVSSCDSGGPSEPDKTLIPHGKLVYVSDEHMLFRYCVETQKKIFLSVSNDSNSHVTYNNKIETIKLPDNARFNTKDNLSVEDYVNEMTLVERVVPKDFFHFYKFVTGYQICNNNLPVSFLTFLKVYNTDGLKALLERYMRSIGKTGRIGNSSNNGV